MYYDGMDYNKKGNLSVNGYITTFIGVVILLLVVAELLPEAQSAGDTLNSSGAPLGGLFASSGVLWIVAMAGILVAVITRLQRNK